MTDFAQAIKLAFGFGGINVAIIFCGFVASRYSGDLFWLQMSFVAAIIFGIASKCAFSWITMLKAERTERNNFNFNNRQPEECAPAEAHDR